MVWDEFVVLFLRFFGVVERKGWVCSDCGGGVCVDFLVFRDRIWMFCFFCVDVVFGVWVVVLIVFWVLRWMLRVMG